MWNVVSQCLRHLNSFFICYLLHVNVYGIQYVSPSQRVQELCPFFKIVTYQYTLISNGIGRYTHHNQWKCCQGLLRLYCIPTLIRIEFFEFTVLMHLIRIPVIGNLKVGVTIKVKHSFKLEPRAALNIIGSKEKTNLYIQQVNYIYTVQSFNPLLPTFLNLFQGMQ